MEEVQLATVYKQALYPMAYITSSEYYGTCSALFLATSKGWSFRPHTKHWVNYIVFWDSVCVFHFDFKNIAHTVRREQKQH